MSAEASMQNGTELIADAEIRYGGSSVEVFLQRLRSLQIELRVSDGKLQLTAPAGAMTPELQDEVRRRKPELMTWFSTQRPAMERTAPLSFAQQRLWLMDRFSPNTAVYNIPQYWEVHGAIDRTALQEAIRLLCERHSSLRTRIAVRGRDALQVILPTVDCEIGYTDLGTATDKADALQEARTRLAEDGRRPFDLAAGPLIRFHLYRVGHEEYVLSYVAHHILADQASLHILQRDLGRLYQAALTGAGSALPLLTTDYAAIAEEERSQAGSERQQRDMVYWRERLHAMPTMLTLPFAAEPQAERTGRGARFSHKLDAALTAKIREMAGRANTSAYFVMLTVFATLLSRYTGLDDLCIGTPLSTRRKREHEELVGLFINMLPLRCRIDLRLPTRQLLEDTRNAVLSDLEHSEVPFQKLVAELHPERTASSPFFQVLFALNPGFSGFGEQPEEVDLLISKYDLTLQINEQRDSYTAHFEYRTDLFSREDIEAVSRTLVALTDAMVSRPELPAGDLDLLSAQDKQRLAEWNDTALAYDTTDTLVSLFSRAAALHADQSAILGASGERSYAELAKEAASIAAALREAGAGRGDVIAVCLERTPLLIASLLGVLQVGAAYLPLDPRYPEARLLFMLRDSGARVLLAASDDLSRRLAAEQPDLRPIDPERVVNLTRGGAGDLPGPGRSVSIQPDDAAYLIYTSGSTGKPKGTVIEHRNAVALLAWAQSFFEAQSLRTMLASTSVCFDLSVFEMFLPLATGNNLLLVKDVLELHGSPYADRVTMINTVPSAMRSLLHAGLPAGVRAVCMAGEFLPTELVNEVYEAGVAQVFDLYGPTETTVYSTAALRVFGAPPTIGMPIANTRVYVLDEHGMRVPPGATGELYLGGSGVSRGYLRQPAMTAERFVVLPAYEGRLYRTGDLVRHRNDGALIYRGRRDQQVKLRGHRIELGEIESTLREISGCSEVAVVVQMRTAGEMLTAFVHTTGPAGEEQHWSDALRRQLPSYMVPSRVECLPALPHTPNGKIDRKALEAMTFESREVTVLYPQDLMEQCLANIFSAHLRVPTISRKAHYFDDLGGNSLMAFETFVDIERVTGVVLMLAVLFEAPTVEQLAQVVQSRQPRRMEHLRLHAAGSTEQVVYVLSDSYTLPVPAAMGKSRIMRVEMKTASQAAAVAEEISLFEVARPPLILAATEAEKPLLEALAGDLRRAGFNSVSIRLVGPQVAQVER